MKNIKNYFFISDEYLFYYTIKQAEQFAKNNSVNIMIEEFKKIQN